MTINQPNGRLLVTTSTISGPNHHGQVPLTTTNHVLGEVVGYPRKSTREEGAGKSLEDQEKHILKTCERFGLPITAEQLLREDKGKSGCLWWRGGGFAGIDGDPQSGKNTRRVLTDIVK